MRDAIGLSLREDRHAIEAPGDDATLDREPSDYQRRVTRIHERLDERIAEAGWEDADGKRLVKRLEKHRYSLFTFVDRPDVPFENNRAEREIRPAVIARKNQYQNASAAGARTQAVLMSVYRTLKLRGLDPLESIADALAMWIATGTRPDRPRGAPPADKPPG